MNQGDLIEKVAAAASITKAEAERAINAFKGAVTDSLRKGHKVTLVGFGTFGVSLRKARRARPPAFFFWTPGRAALSNGRMPTATRNSAIHTLDNLRAFRAPA